MLTRRVLLRGSAVVMAGGRSHARLARPCGRSDRFTRRQKKKMSSWAIFQRGAADGLNIVVPFAEKRYYEMRPSIAIAAPGATNVQNPGPFGGAAIDLDGRFGLNPALEALENRSGTKSNWRSPKRPVRPILRAPTSMPRTIWNRAHPANRRATAGSIARSHPRRTKPRHCAPSRWVHRCR